MTEGTVVEPAREKEAIVVEMHKQPVVEPKQRRSLPVLQVIDSGNPNAEKALAGADLAGADVEQSQVRRIS
jgi:hypothetical protein